MTDAPQIVASVVVVGASAGGIEAFLTVLQTLPPTFPAPIVVAQHLALDFPSRLARVFQRQTALAVVTVSAPTALAVATIYVPPPNRHLVLDADGIALAADPPSRPRPSIDMLCQTAVRTYGSSVIAVVLSGLGTDGVRGAATVRAHGGRVVIQHPDSALYPTLPTISAMVLDGTAEVVALHAIGQHLVAWLMPDG